MVEAGEDGGGWGGCWRLGRTVETGEDSGKNKRPMSWNEEARLVRSTTPAQRDEMQWSSLQVAYLEVDTLRVLWTVSRVAGLITKVLFHHCHNLHMMCRLDIKKPLILTEGDK